MRQIFIESMSSEEAENVDWFGIYKLVVELKGKIRFYSPFLQDENQCTK